MENKEAQEFVNRVYEYTANLMFEQKKNQSETKEILIEQGLTAEDADIVITNLQEQMKQAKNSAANKNMIYGALWCVGGLLVTAITYSVASENGGTYIVTWGAVIFGAIQFFKGLFQKLS
ncbi:MAG: hypothetical protein IKY67_00515 [Paludibacteraceae bacterium]|nr:hypothetical protein [Paludibacteraceae bacterium]